MTLTPDGIAVSGWVANTGTVDGALAVNNGDTAYAEAGADGETCTLRFTNPGVAEGAISSITSVRILTYGRYPARGTGGEEVCKKRNLQEYTSQSVVPRVHFAECTSHSIAPRAE